jgi:hypothetical protein
LPIKLTSPCNSYLNQNECGLLEVLVLVDLAGMEQVDDGVMMLDQHSTQ